MIVQTRRGARGSSASSTLIAIFSAMPGGASVYAATRSRKRRISGGSGGVGSTSRIGFSLSTGSASPASPSHTTPTRCRDPSPTRTKQPGSGTAIPSGAR